MPANSADPIGRKIATLQKNLQRDKKQGDKEARKLRDENARLQREMADLSSAMGDARSKVCIHRHNQRSYSAIRGHYPVNAQ